MPQANKAAFAASDGLIDSLDEAVAAAVDRTLARAAVDGVDAGLLDDAGLLPLDFEALLAVGLLQATSMTRPQPTAPTPKRRFPHTSEHFGPSCQACSFGEMR